MKKKEFHFIYFGFYIFNLKEFALADFNYLVDGWNEKLIRTKQGHQKWGAFYAEKK